ncbi:hypothetical protein [Halomarina oriensis]|uniref:Uncharacterized protein n=1 Tax=Halomarina oriensis TaxID=671145 RepID=A0A6B0GM60_9EURY|nr:hypothetical protein [Halomarina oriensis]MWG35942.1 hypothetical protein [Halomarina oriensis]
MWRKHVNVELTRTEAPVWTDILKLQFDPEDSEVFGAFDPAYLSGAVDGASVTISSEMHDALTTEFGGVNYEVTLGPINEAGDHLHAQAHRNAFNNLPLAGDASVENFWVQVDDDLRVGYIRPTEAASPTQPPTTTDIGQFDLGTSFEGY